jgi:predicted transcriptional regulator
MKMVGFITRDDLRQLEVEEQNDLLLSEVSIKEVVSSYPDQPLDAVMLKLGQRELSLLPVVSRKDPQKLLGIISMRDIVRTQARIAARENQQQLRRRMKRKNKKNATPTVIDDDLAKSEGAAS